MHFIGFMLLLSTPSLFFPHGFEKNALLVVKVKKKEQWNKSESLDIRGSLLHREMRWSKMSYLPTVVTHSTSCESRFMALRDARRSQPGVQLFLRAPQELWGWAWAPAALEENSHLLLRKARMGPRDALPSSLPPPPFLHTAPAWSANPYRICLRHKHIHL